MHNGEMLSKSAGTKHAVFSLDTTPESERKPSQFRDSQFRDLAVALSPGANIFPA